MPKSKILQTGKLVGSVSLFVFSQLFRLKRNSSIIFGTVQLFEKKFDFPEIRDGPQLDFTKNFKTIFHFSTLSTFGYFTCDHLCESGRRENSESLSLCPPPISLATLCPPLCHSLHYVPPK